MNKIILFHNLVDIWQQKIYPAKITIENNKIISIEETTEICQYYILPGFVDAHIHIESSMLVPSEFAKVAVQFGTIATVSDPHEIANVCGIDGVLFMLENAAKVPFHFFFGAPSCVPATSFETAGAKLNAQDIKTLLQRDDIWYLSEMMNYPGVLFNDIEVMEKIVAAKQLNKPIDGHAPALTGDDAIKYFAAGISSDHECFTYHEGAEKLNLGVNILIREGSAAKNFEALIPLLSINADKIMFCCDDKHPDELLLHHINKHVKTAIQKGYNIFDVLKAACINPVLHYRLPLGLLRQGDSADYIIVKDLQNFDVISTVIKGKKVYEENQVLFTAEKENIINNFQCDTKEENDFKIYNEHNHTKINVIEALDGQLITNHIQTEATIINNEIVSNVEKDILKIVVVNRYQNAPVSVSFIKNIGLQKGAIASSVAHDSHNIVCVGVRDKDICNAVNAIIKHKGGISVADNENIDILPLPIAGIMSNESAEVVSKLYSEIDKKAKALGTQLQAPFMTLSFMALPVIPQLKISDKGLFDVAKFDFIENTIL